MCAYFIQFSLFLFIFICTNENINKIHGKHLKMEMGEREKAGCNWMEQLNY